jgi:hypothetical protein
MSQVDKEELSYEIPSPEILSSDFLVSRRGKIPSIIEKETTELQDLEFSMSIRLETLLNYPVDFAEDPRVHL